MNHAMPLIEITKPVRRLPWGRWTTGGGGPPATAPRAKASAPTAPTVNTVLQQLGHLMSPLNPVGTAAAQEIDPEEENRGLEEPSDPTQEVRTARYYEAMNALRAIDPKNPELVTLTAPNYVPSEVDVLRVQEAIRAVSARRNQLPSVGGQNPNLPESQKGPDGSVGIQPALGAGSPPKPTPGGMPPLLHRGQQDKHVPGTNNYDPIRSILDHPNPQELLNRGAGTGISANSIPAGQPGSKERVDFGEIIGRSRNQDTEQLTSTTKGMIHYSKKGAHIVPVAPHDVRKVN